ncbi:1-acyl-sn-glycerol-3-phosphate acyltransferase [Haliscomenobacter hydrossis]|uniref:Phospholipid/glycerol acyltransferase n=1 Tax=Haliscomenobacter hydrossis (strain ATCC 27775 / DSM 1100 / LMG 10767 / O) TaxID=760192 RepID=F4KPD5_HALH1|nr:1-acyl-sn-glycerol-3-phosphate acyltransferase [Haliscomenobacter hydrossis]AEE49889.1 phospholipid/glycerol acyltransferase [Haliscomenobacter hydrossis DSM 1100]
MSLLQRIVYTILKALIKIVVHVYYPHIYLEGKDKLKLKGPTIVLGNHPNTLMDALNGALWVDQPVYFLAMARLFKPDWVGNILRFLFCIPLERRKDNGGGPVDNEDSFRQAIEHLSKHRHLFIAPDGGNELERNLLPLKTGTARISLGAENLQDFQLGLRILPLGYTYFGDREQFGSEMLIQAGEPIFLKDFAETYASDPQGTVRRLTALLEKRMQDLLLNVKDEEEDQMLHTLEELLRDEAPLPLSDFFQRSKALMHRLRNFAIEEPEQHALFLAQVQAYAAALKSVRIRSGAVYLQQLGPVARQQQLLPFWLLLPIWVFAAINHWPATALCRFAVRRFNLHIGYKTTVELCVGLLAIPIFYVLQSLLVEAMSSTAWSWWYLAATIGTGLITLKNKRRMDNGLSYLKLKNAGPIKDKLAEERAALVTQLHDLLQSIPQ